MMTADKTIGCVKAATYILGDKWTPQLLRFFANNSRLRFCQLQELVGGINPRTLSARLSYLEAQSVIEKLPATAAARCQYQLTNKGRALLPIVRDMEQWSTRYHQAADKASLKHQTIQ